MRHWDLAAGVSTSFLAIMKAGLSYSEGYYATCEINPSSAGVFRANHSAILEAYPAKSSHAQKLDNFENYIPGDLFVLAREAREVLAKMPDSELPSYISASVPCTESSKARLGGGGRTEIGKLYLCVVAVVWAVQLEYEHRGLAEQGRASVGWMYETSPTDDPRKNIASLRSQLEVLLGKPALPDEARSGGTTRRKNCALTWGMLKPGRH